MASREKKDLTIKEELKVEQKGLSWFFRSHTFKIIISIVIFAVLVIGTIYLSVSNSRIYIEKSEINAPMITLSSNSSGILDKVFVREGDIIPADTVVAQVDGNKIKSKVDGLVIFVQNTPGQVVTTQTPIVQMIDPQELRVVGHLQEDKGLSVIKIGQSAIFTVDAFGSKKYSGVVDSISQTSRQSDIVFSISNNREEREFDIKIKFDQTSYPELKNGMSAKIWVYK